MEGPERAPGLLVTNQCGFNEDGEHGSAQKGSTCCLECGAHSPVFSFARGSSPYAASIASAASRTSGAVLFGTVISIR